MTDSPKKKRTKKRYSSSMKKEVRAELAAGLKSAKEISKERDVPYSTVLTWRSKKGRKKGKTARNIQYQAVEAVPWPLEELGMKAGEEDLEKKSKDPLVAEHAALKLLLMQAKPYLPEELRKLAEQLGL